MFPAPASHPTARAVSTLLLAVLLAAGCAVSAPDAHRSTTEAPRYSAEITRTEFGIPHVRAANFASLGYGIGHAYAQDNFCILAEKINQLNGERSRYFGGDHPVAFGIGRSISSRSSDFFHKSQFPREAVAAAWRNGSQVQVELTRGYVAGLNRYLRDTGIENLPSPCRGAAWVRQLTEDDLYLWYTSVATRLGAQQFAEAIVSAQPPDRAAARGGGRTRQEQTIAAVAEPPMAFSNAWAFGRETTENGRGLLFGNPHWAWGTIDQFYQAHLTIPGILDVMGVTYGGVPAVVIGFNRSVAWSHTVSTGSRFVIRELTLVDDSPTTYVVDGERHEMDQRVVTIDVLGDDGAVRQESRTFHTTKYGPVIARQGMPWSATTAYALTDVNVENTRIVDQWVGIGRAQSASEVRASLASFLAVPWVNTLAADIGGNALYADYSTKPYVTDAMIEACGGSETAKRFTRSGALTLDGSRSACDPLSDPQAPQKGILPPRLLPLLERSDYVANSNNTYWLTNPREPITGLPSVNGRAGEPLDFRAQSGLLLIEGRLAGSDSLPGNRFTSEAVRALVFGTPQYPAMGNYNRAAEVVLDAVRALCVEPEPVTLAEGGPVDLTVGCRVLTSWDARHSLDSAGAHLFREFWSSASRVPQLWAMPFDAARPLETPRHPNLANPEVRKALREALAGAVTKFGALGIALDRPWGEVHTHRIGERRIPVDGNISDVLNMMVAPQLTAAGYGPVVHGASYVQIATFGETGPEVDAVLLFGQSTNPDSPFYFDQLQQLWVEQKWNRLPFTPEDVAARAVSRITLEE